MSRASLLVNPQSCCFRVSEEGQQHDSCLVLDERIQQKIPHVVLRIAGPGDAAIAQSHTARGAR